MNLKAGAMVFAGLLLGAVILGPAVSEGRGRNGGGRGPGNCSPANCAQRNPDCDQSRQRLRDGSGAGARRGTPPADCPGPANCPGQQGQGPQTPPANR